MTDLIDNMTLLINNWTFHFLKYRSLKSKLFHNFQISVLLVQVTIHFNEVEIIVDS